MITNALITFIIPWVFGVILYFKDKRILLIIAPIAGVIAYTFNALGSFFKLWRFAPFDIDGNFTTMFANLGLYPILASYTIYYIHKKTLSPFGGILLFTLITTFLEYLALLFNLLTYSNGWNIGWTFVSYLIPYILVYLYYYKLKTLP